MDHLLWVDFLNQLQGFSVNLGAEQAVHLRAEPEEDALLRVSGQTVVLGWQDWTNRNYGFEWMVQGGTKTTESTKQQINTNQRNKETNMEKTAWPGRQLDPTEDDCAGRICAICPGPSGGGGEESHLQQPTFGASRRHRGQRSDTKSVPG